MPHGSSHRGEPYRHGLHGPELADALDVSTESAKKMVQRMRDTIERSLGALLVARSARSAENGCPELGAILHGWDGQFTILMRKRIARHIESCPDCELDRRRRVSPVALLGGVPLFIPAPRWLRDQTLSQVQLTASSTNATAAETVEETARDGAAGRKANHPESAERQDGDANGFFTRRLIVCAALFAGIPLAVLGLTITWLEVRTTSITPIGVTETTPASTTNTPYIGPPQTPILTSPPPTTTTRAPRPTKQTPPPTPEVSAEPPEPTPPPLLEPPPPGPVELPPSPPELPGPQEPQPNDEFPPPPDDPEPTDDPDPGRGRGTPPLPTTTTEPTPAPNA